MINHSRILIIEDSSIFNTLVSSLLKKEGFCITSALTFHEAKTFLQNTTFDLIILDWYLDKEYTGADIIPFISPSSKIILFSSLSPNSFIRALPYFSKIDAYIHKGEPEKHVLLTIHNTLNTT